MNDNKDILPKDEEGGYHGFCKLYYDNGDLCWIGMKVNNLDYGYFEQYGKKGIVDEAMTGYFMSSKKISVDNTEGYCYVWNMIEQ